MLILLIIAAIAAVGGILAGAWWLTQCPCERIPGAWLQGAEETAPVSDWTFANEAPICYIEVPGAIPHSVTLNCMANGGGTLYLSCSRCDGKRWSTIAVATGQARIRIAETVYPVTIARVTEPAELDRAWAARADKLARLRGPAGAPPPRPGHWWSFRLESRG